MALFKKRTGIKRKLDIVHKLFIYNVILVMEGSTAGEMYNVICKDESQTRVD